MSVLSADRLYQIKIYAYPIRGCFTYLTLSAQCNILLRQGIIQGLFHVFLNNIEMAIFLLFFKLYIIFFLHYVSVIFEKREPLIKLFFTVFVRRKLRCKMSGVILKCAKRL